MQDRFEQDSYTPSPSAPFFRTFAQPPLTPKLLLLKRLPG